MIINNTPLHEYEGKYFHVYKENANQNSLIMLEQNYKDLGNWNDYLMFIRYSRKYGHNPAEFDALPYVNVPQLSSTTVTQSFQKAENVPPCALCLHSSLPKGYVCYQSILSTTINHTLET